MKILNKYRFRRNIWINKQTISQEKKRTKERKENLIREYF
jgi:hypothetical protein